MFLPLERTFDQGRWHFRETAGGDREFKLSDLDLTDYPLMRMLKELKPEVRFNSTLLETGF